MISQFWLSRTHIFDWFNLSPRKTPNNLFVFHLVTDNFSIAIRFWSDAKDYFSDLVLCLNEESRYSSQGFHCFYFHFNLLPFPKSFGNSIYLEIPFFKFYHFPVYFGIYQLPITNYLEITIYHLFWNLPISKIFWNLPIYHLFGNSIF